MKRTKRRSVKTMWVETSKEETYRPEYYRASAGGLDWGSHKFRRVPTKVFNDLQRAEGNLQRARKAIASYFREVGP
jgi:hypothetical protein